MQGFEKVFITGASGFIGRALTARCRERGVDVGGVDVVADPSAGVVAGDTSRPGDWQRAIEGADLVIHAAALLSLRGDDQRFWEVNVLGTRNALDAAAAARVRRFVHLSSITAFSYEFPDGVDEHHPVRTNGSPYVDTKVTSEQVVLQAFGAAELDCTVIRPADVYGPGSRPWTILPVEMIKRGRFVLPAGGRGIFSPVYIDNLVDGIELAAGSPEASGQVFTIGDGVGVTTAEFFAPYTRMLGKPPLRTLPSAVAGPLAGGAYWAARLAGRHEDLNPDSVRYLSRTGTYSIEKARRVLGYEPRVALDEGFERTEEWLRSEGLVP